METATIAHFGTAIATAVLVGVGIWGISATRNSLELSERAWISTTGASLRVDPNANQPTPLQKNQPIHFAISFINSGRQPALDINWRIKNASIDSFNYHLSSMDEIVVPHNTSCSGLAIEKGRFTMTPGLLSTLEFDTAHGDPQFYADDRIVDGSKFYVVLGCLAYTTFEAARHSGFCYVFENVPAENRRVFVTCASGFDTD
jgi:hypothetical protein